ncbi:unnamed protein product [Diatraea saccharalis]|uniref:FP protein C-terminal domain-containing protein n=1 Tax=Diatraea saccharalis TaxID=40085 RepID=A0A9N9QU32_9NEOP|nr:unnamed protein product [Diatraea saccharalis]
MPLKRTPPPANALLGAGQLQHSESAPNITTAQEHEDESGEIRALGRNIKRKRSDSSEELSNLKCEITSMFASWKAEQDSKFDTLLIALNDIKSQNANIHKSLEFLSEKYDELIERINTLEQDKRHQRDYINTLETKIENLERNFKVKSIEIRNIPTKINETTEDLMKIVQKTGAVIDLKIEKNDICDIYRTNTKNITQKPITVNFNSALTKEKFLKSVKKFNRDNRGSTLNTTQLKIDEESRPVFVSELLTAKAKRLFYLARDFAKSNQYSFCWTSHGRIFIRKNEGSPQVRIDGEDQLLQLKGK